ncbi:kinase-like domain-containing protein [Hypoxylon cercidicola]|nr:kinase-like domain-containing protein [Hypoxylon cercidicola]
MPASYGNKSADDIEAELRAHFATQYRKFTFEGLIGRGAFGLAFRLVEKVSENKVRRLAVKRSLPRKEDDLRNEIRYLMRLRGAEHIVRLLASRDEEEPMPGRQRARGIMNARRLGLQDSLTGITGPIAVLEYMENGDLKQLVNRCIRNDQLLPNRILWSLFLCLIRACIALSYPPNGAEGQPNQLEIVPTDGTAPSLIEHADLHAANIMIGDIGGFPEHGLVPSLKFIDFGRTRELPQGIPDNVWKISRIMIDLITRQQLRISTWITSYNGFETRATEILPHGNGWQYPTLDPDLRDFLARCLAHKQQDRPDLSTMLRIAEDAVRTKTAEAYPGKADETDEAIHKLLQEYIYDGDTK